MNSIKAVFIKQALDMFRNKVVLIQFILFPLIALIFTELVSKPNAAPNSAEPNMPYSMFVTIFAAVFIGYTLLTTTAGIIAEDTERKSLRFLIMAGVKPHEYFLGVCGIILLVTLPVSVVFGLIGNFSGIAIIKFICVMMCGSVASMLLGAAVGILSKNQQSAHAASMSVAVIIGFGPMITMFNETAGKILGVLYTQQINVIVNDLSAGTMRPLSVIAANIAVFAALFGIAYMKKGLKG